MYKTALVLSTITLLLASCGEPKEEAVVKGQKDLDSLLIAHPDSIDLLLQHGKANIQSYNFEVALADAAKAFRLDSNNIEARELYAKVLNNKPGRSIADVAGAQRHYLIVSKAKPKNTDVLVGLASTYRQQLDFESTFKYVNEALRIDPKCRDAYVLKGSTYVFLGDVDLAKSSYETAVQQDPDFFEAYIMLGSLYEGEGDEISIQYYTTALQLKPKDLDATYALAFAKHNFGYIEDAKKLYREMATDTAEYYVARGLFHQGHIKQFEEMDIDSAMYFYNSALTTSPMHVESWFNLGMCYLDQKDNSKALQAFSKTLKYARQQNYKPEFIDEVEKKAKAVN